MAATGAREAIYLGAPYMWRLDERGASTREDKLASVFRVSGLSSEFDAKIVAGAHPGMWAFWIRSQGHPAADFRSGYDYESKEAAVEGLKVWLAKL
jgi:hypothetical protein